MPVRESPMQKIFNSKVTTFDDHRLGFECCKVQRKDLKASLHPKLASSQSYAELPDFWLQHYLNWLRHAFIFNAAFDRGRKEIDLVSS